MKKFEFLDNGSFAWTLGGRAGIALWITQMNRHRIGLLSD